MLYFLAWLIADWVWDGLTGYMIAGVGDIGANDSEAIRMKLSGEVPGRMAAMMIVDLVGTLVLPWIVAGFFLNWFGIS